MKAEATRRNGHSTPLLPVFILISLLSHLLLLLLLAITNALQQPGSESEAGHALSVRITTVQEPLSATGLPAAPHSESTAALDKSQSRPGMHNKPQQPVNEAHSVSQAKERQKISAIELMQKAFDALPAISEATEQTDVPTGRVVIFDRRFRKKLEQARHEQARRRELNASLEEHPEFEVIRDDGDSFTVRTGDKCWNIPVTDVPDPFNSRIVMRDFRC